ncbi:RNA-binding protein 5-like protein [Leptomonas pyrrhocoris]|uniref:RNA-binding protein 5-like protein n=1 Tax=Leptomonas pyrrhocoris TaxID=157538 RepID=A0A0M9FWJ9_LEPPY|nr:RNA-binding protein 5-like protein [Leptomonas pyrrhocoris]KPA77429.1 RNA-binding protein 5-like protein [Leptomonas pyrrhocoris]|eukprot:XP_015655868.1 RNA-binding protein 5-like protein [Leptomonas pyrrhocoris]
MISTAIFPRNASAFTAGQNRNVYVASLPMNFDDQELHNLFSPYGRIISARIMRAKKSHLSKGYGFVMYREVSAAEQAIQGLHGRVVGGSRIQVRWASADASTTFSKVSHTPALPSVSTPAASAAAAITTTATAAVPNAHVVSIATNPYTPQIQSQAYMLIAPTMQYEQQPPPQPGATTFALHQNYGALLNSPLVVAANSGVMQAAFAPQSPLQPILPQLSSSPPQQPMHLMVLPNGERHIVQFNQLSFQNI